MIRNNKDYANLENLYADDNELTSLGDFRDFLGDGLAELYLNINRITQFDLEVFKQLMQSKKHHFPRFYLSENPWSCDWSCKRLKEIQQFIWEHNEIIGDHEHLQCLDGTKIIEIDYNALCMASSNTDSMTILICIEVVLLVLIVSKLSYDYRQYNRTGTLPWLARSGCLSYNLPAKSEIRNPGQPFHESFKSTLFQRCFNGSADQVPSEDSRTGHLDVFRPKRYFLSPRQMSELDSIDEVSSTGGTNEDSSHQNGMRTKKISIEEAEALDKNVLDPDESSSSYAMKEFTLIVHQPEEDEERRPLRKISRLQKSNSAGLDVNPREALF